MNTRNILDKNYQKVGVLKELEDGDVAVEIEDRYLGVFRSFDAWNNGTGNAYILEDGIDFSDFSINFETTDIDLELNIDPKDYDNYINWDGN